MSNLTVKGNASGTGTVILEAPNTNSNRTITLPDSTSTLATTADVAAVVTGPTLGTAVASTSGTAIDFTGIPSTAKRVTVMLSGVSLSGISSVLVQLGSGSVQTTGYAATSGGISSTSGFPVAIADASASIRAVMTLFLVTGNSWVESGTVSYSSGSGGSFAGIVSLSGTLDRVRITTVNGTDTFDAGTINISWE